MWPNHTVGPEAAATQAAAAAAAGQGAAVVVAGRRRRCRRRGHQTLPCSERLRGERVAEPPRSRRSQCARRGALASQALPFIAGATCKPPAANRGRAWGGHRRAGAEVRPPRASRRGGRRRCEPVDEWRSAGVGASPGQGRAGPSGARGRTTPEVGRDESGRGFRSPDWRDSRRGGHACHMGGLKFAPNLKRNPFSAGTGSQP